MPKLLLLILMLFAFRACSNASTVTLTWNYDYTTNPACTATVKINCVNGFQVLDNSGGVIASVPNPSPATGVVTGISFSFTSSTYGTSTPLSVITVGIGPTGAVVLSKPAVVNAIIIPSAPTALMQQP